MNPSILRGVVLPGIGAASKTIPNQWHTLKKLDPDICSCLQATINVWLEKPLAVFSPILQSERIQWFPGGPFERFNLIPIRFVVEGGDQKGVTAWVYMAELSPHRRNPLVAEIIAPDLRSVIKPGVPVEIHLPETIRNLGWAFVK